MFTAVAVLSVLLGQAYHNFQGSPPSWAPLRLYNFTPRLSLCPSLTGIQVFSISATWTSGARSSLFEWGLSCALDGTEWWDHRGRLRPCSATALRIMLTSPHLKSQLRSNFLESCSPPYTTQSPHNPEPWEVPWVLAQWEPLRKMT